MKNYKKLVLGLVIAMSCSIYEASAQIYVNVRPARPVYVRSVAPSPRHIWIDEDWQEVNGTYVFIGGHWAEPPQADYIYESGHWGHTNRGHRWEPGRWHGKEERNRNNRNHDNRR